MSQNTSSAVMQQRKEPHDSLDFFPTPPWATRALCEYLARALMAEIERQTVWEPACGEGHMAIPLAGYFANVRVSDVHPYRFASVVGTIHDFLGIAPPPFEGKPDWIITNPPFRLAEEFARRAFREATVGVALLVRSAFLESVGRFRNLFEPFPPTSILQFTERVPMVKGRLDRESTTATAYCWLVWTAPFGALAAGPRAPSFHWIAPCRARLERTDDYVDDYVERSP